MHRAAASSDVPAPGGNEARLYRVVEVEVEREHDVESPKATGTLSVPADDRIPTAGVLVPAGNPSRTKRGLPHPALRGYLLGAALILVAVGGFVTAYYLNHPRPETDPDTIGYLTAAHNVLAHSQFVDPLRTPGYPLFVALLFAVFGAGNLQAVSIAQGILFVVAALELYTLTTLITRRAWAGVLVALVAGTNTYILTWVKPIIVEGFGLWLTVTLALAVVLFVRRPTAWRLWLAALVTLALFMTRPEWIYAPIPLLAYLLFVAARQGRARRLLPHALAAVVALYAVLGLYVYANAQQNGYAGVTVVQRVNLLGKVIQYHMQDEADPQYADIARQVDVFIADGNVDPWGFLGQHPELQANSYARVGDYAASAVRNSPAEFAAKTFPFLLASPNHYWAWSQITPAGPLSRPLSLIQTLSGWLHHLFVLVFLFALFWLALLLWPRASRAAPVQAMAGLTLLALYDLLVTSVASYHPLDLVRIQTSLDPLLVAVVVGSIPAALALVTVRPGAPTLTASRPLPRSMTNPTVSFLIPAYNERTTIAQVVERVRGLPYDKEVLVVDDCSTDGTRELLQQTHWPDDVRILYHERNQGKGAAIRTAVRAATKEILIIQDADLEYNPDDIPTVLRPILDGVADVVYGSRFLGIHRSFMLHHYLGNKFLTIVTNVLFGNMLTDMETGYKAFRAPVIKDVTIRSNRFDFEPEITAKVLKRGYRIYEVPIYYAGRDYAEGKKITWRDGFAAMWALLKFRLTD